MFLSSRWSESELFLIVFNLKNLNLRSACKNFTRMRIKTHVGNVLL